MKKALIAMSGGVDSAVAALLTLETGAAAVGCTMKLHGGEEAGRPGTCCALSDVEDARSVAVRLGMPHYVFNFQDDFRDAVIKPFCESYLRGETPNPCIECNRSLKFGRLYARAMELGCDTVVTGHYARAVEENGRFLLKKALDPDKDQSYVLYMLTPEQLRHTFFPLGTRTKPEVRRIAAEHGFVNADKPDSQDICFVPDGDYAAVVERETGVVSPPGDFIDASGKVLGTHRGVIRYTVGQRRGLGIPAERSLYVTSLDPAANTVTLGYKEALFSDTCELRNINLISVPKIEGALRAAVKIRYRHPEQPAVVTQTGPDTLLVRFDEPQRAITKGQAAVIYDGDVVVGGGTIAKVIKDES